MIVIKDCGWGIENGRFINEDEGLMLEDEGFIIEGGGLRMNRLTACLRGWERGPVTVRMNTHSRNMNLKT